MVDLIFENSYNIIEAMKWLPTIEFPPEAGEKSFEERPSNMGSQVEPP